MHAGSNTVIVSVLHNMAKSDRERELERRIEELEGEVASLRNGAPMRSKIAKMSAEVVDSNPYR